MPPAAPDDLIRQHSRSLEDEPPVISDPTPVILEHEPSSKSKKKKTKKAAKAARLAAETPDGSTQPSGPASIEPSSGPEPSSYPEPSSCPEPSLDHHVPPTVTSPVLDVLGSIEGNDEHDLTTRTDTWAQSVPFGKSPPTDLIDGEIPNESPVNFPTIQARGGFSQPSSASPPTQIRPFSYGSGFRSNMNSRQQSVDRRKSHSYGSPMSNLAPLPHLPQPHFYGAPDIDLPAQPRSAIEGTYSFCAFDTLPNLSKASRGALNVLVIGTDNGVEVQAIEDQGTRLVGQITGLNGRVIEAKIVPGHVVTESSASPQPHVAVILHGPLAPNDEERPASAAASEINEVPPSMAPSRGHSNDRRTARDVIPYYQTRVEVYSLRSGAHVTTLLASKAIPCIENIPGLPSLAPSPAGSLKLLVGAGHVIVASGASGEVFVYRQTPSAAYQCLGKVWTNVQAGEARRYSNSSSSTDPDGSHSDSPRASLGERPTLAVQGRWLAIVPPSSSHRPSMQAVVPPSLVHERAQGLETRSPPTIPSVNCGTDVGDGESLLDKVTRGVTQELVKGARWMGDQGMQAWNSYWNNPQSTGTPPLRPSRGTDSPISGYGLFPPTHAQDTQATSSPEPDTVSIIDLKRFDDGMDAKTASLHPTATFQVPNGCSFLSLSPNGLMLFTASKKGDVQYVWDLMQLRNCRAMAFMTDDLADQSSSVRQVARYARLTTSSIVDVIWTAPVGDRLAIITRKGTVHVFDLPRSAFQWPPFRRVRPVAKKSPALDPMNEDLPGQASSGNPLSAAMKLVGGKTQPFFSAMRGRAATTSGATAFPNISSFALPTAATIKGGKVVATGLGKSVGAAATGTVHKLRHVGENRLHLVGLAKDPAPSRVIWICSKGLIYLGVVDDGDFKQYRLKRGATSHKNRQFHTVIGGKEKQYKLPDILHNPSGPAPLMPYDPELVVRGTLLLPSASAHPSSIGRPLCQPLSQAEIETNTPYQPFHTDQRVGLHIYVSQSDRAGSSLAAPGGQWVFGGDIPITKVHVRSYNTSDAAADDEQDDSGAIHGHSFGAGGDMENLISLANSTGHVEEVVITTRRKKKASAPLKVDDGFFEDDCEVLDFARDRV